MAERYLPAGAALGVFVLTQEILELVRPTAIIMHPLPRNIGAGPSVPQELPKAFTDDPRVRCFEQAHAKYLVAGAVLYLLLGET